MTETPRLSPSIAHVLLEESPLHAWTIHRLLGNRPKPTTEPQERGRILHALILGEFADLITVVNADSYRTKDAQQQRDAAREAGLIPVLEPRLMELAEVARRLQERIYDEYNYDLKAGDAEVRLHWEAGSIGGATCEATGVLDWIGKDGSLVIDIKTTAGSVHPAACAANLVRSAGALQARAYVEAIEATKPDLAGRCEIHFLYCETTDPYAVTPVIPDGSLAELGQRRWERAVEVWAKCLAEGRWPAAADAPVRVGAPAWALAREEYLEE